MEPLETTIISQLRRVQLLRDCNLSIVLKGHHSALEIESVNSEALAQSILGIARLADDYGLREVTIKPLDDNSFEALTFETNCLRFFQMDITTLDTIRNRASRHQALLNALPSTNVVSIYLHAAEEPHTHLDCRVELEERMNVPMIDLLGSPVMRLESQLAELRAFWIKRAVSLGSAQSYTYCYSDKDNHLDWHFKVDVAPLAGSEEVIAIVSDLEPWQKPWWESQRARPSAR